MNMPITIKSGEPLSSTNEKLREAQARIPRIDTTKYCGSIRLTESPDRYQERSRNEWDRSAR